MEMNQARNQDPLAQALGWASLGLGIPQTLMPGRFARAIGIRDDSRSRVWTRIVGARELAAAAGILVLEQPRPASWLWARVAGDAKDLGLLVTALVTKAEDRDRVGAAIAAVLGIAAADVTAAVRLTRRARPSAAAITVGRPLEEVERRWRSANGATARFVPAPREQGTEIHLAIGQGGPEETMKAKAELRRFKQELETGLVVRSDGSPEGHRPRRLFRQRPAHPAAAPVGTGGGVA
jgi:hypothetical protein